ncbi:response regulator transcription factor [Segetibacter sp.]|jgi:DNA-binding response OmpR family regulator|uniref:response regulator transcription factor n=1 Tax=Segetibacter sp. TaxID=2231182 RepID=UPI00263A1669|nr:response regulator transcription factor [Segetibacter sp.]MCW3080273.1 DNA-binding response regulator [Segetibacter sp.]
MRLLLVEDEPEVASFIKKSLEEGDYEVTVAMDGTMAWETINSFKYDLLIFDLMLPGINGLELCKKCRQQKILTPILMLTALGATDNIIMGLDSGADDYLTKPFKLTELEARIRSLLRRIRPAENEVTEPPTKNSLAFADVVLDLDEKSVTRNKVPVELTATEFRLLEYLLRNPRKVVSRMDILEKVWGYDFNLNTKVVDVYINYLRKKLDKDSKLKLINTVTGMGYILKEVYNEDPN